MRGSIYVERQKRCHPLRAAVNGLAGRHTESHIPAVGQMVAQIALIGVVLGVAVIGGSSAARAAEADGGSGSVLVGSACLNPSPDGVVTRLSGDRTQGILQCIPNSEGVYSWQPMGAGGALYDSSSSCRTGGQLRWNGAEVQYCDGTGWKALATASRGNGQLHSHGRGSYEYWCDAGYHVVEFQGRDSGSELYYWYECQPD